MLSKEEKSYYSRQIIIPEFGMASQLKLKNAKILVIGAGGLGAPIIQSLAAAGVGQIDIVDYDKLHISNLHRQSIYTYTEIGQDKANLASAFAKRLNPFIQSKPISVKVEKDNILELIAPYELVVDCTDNFEVKYLINDACVFLNKCLVFGSVFRNEGNISVFNLDANAPTLRSLFPIKPINFNNCETAGILGITSSTTALFMANEVVRIITNQSGILSGKLLIYNNIDSSIKTISYKASKKGREASMDTFR